MTQSRRTYRKIYDNLQKHFQEGESFKPLLRKRSSCIGRVRAGQSVHGLHNTVREIHISVKGCEATGLGGNRGRPKATATSDVTGQKWCGQVTEGFESRDWSEM